MKRRLALACGAAVLGICLGCSQSDRQTERQKSAEAQEKAKKLGQELKQEAKELDRNINRAVGEPGGTGQAEQKLKDGGEKLRVAGDQAGVKLDHAATIARVKAKLASDVGLSTVTSVDVDASGQVVTLRGTVSSEDQKQRAEDAVKQLDGVTRVVNLLRVQ